MQSELIDELEQIKKAISVILIAGQSYTINTGGGSRQVSYVNYADLVKRKNDLEMEIEASSGGLGTRITAAW